MKHADIPGSEPFAAKCVSIPGSETPIGAGFRSPAAEGRTLQTAIALCVSALAAFLLLFAIAPAMAYAANAQIDAPVTVSDDVTRLQVNKLDSDTHEYVEGATMAIINAETDEVVDSWVTGSATHENSKLLDVGVEYILRELSAPSGYSAVQDVHFVVKETEGEGVEILSSGDDAELTESYKVVLYDKPLATQTETVETKTTTSSTVSSTTSTKTTTSTTVAPKTGDETPLSLVAALMAIGVSVILILQLFKRRLDREEE